MVCWGSLTENSEYGSTSSYSICTSSRRIEHYASGPACPAHMGFTMQPTMSIPAGHGRQLHICADMTLLARYLPWISCRLCLMPENQVQQQGGVELTREIQLKLRHRLRGSGCYWFQVIIEHPGCLTPLDYNPSQPKPHA